MSTQIVHTPNMVMVIKLLVGFTVKSLTGIDNIPHLCVKVRHGDGYSWFGINIITVINSDPWTQKTAEINKERFMEAMTKIVDLQEMITDVPRLMDSIQDITTGRRRPVMFGGLCNEKIQITGKNNIQLEVVRDLVKEESLTYGGYLFELTIFTQDGTPEYLALFMYHRGVVLYNYASEEEALQYAYDELNAAFPELGYVKPISITFTTTLLRQRSTSFKRVT